MCVGGLSQNANLWERLLFMSQCELILKCFLEVLLDEKGMKTALVRQQLWRDMQWWEQLREWTMKVKIQLGLPHSPSPGLHIAVRGVTTLSNSRPWSYPLTLLSLCVQSAVTSIDYMSEVFL